MAIDYEKLLNFEIPDVRQTRTQKDTMLYALSLGLGMNAVDENELKFVYEKNLQALPTMAVVLCAPHGWLRQSGTGVGGKIVHGGQKIVMHQALPVEGKFLGKSRVTGVIDKGLGKGALVITERRVYDDTSGDLICALESTSFCRGDGGFNGPAGPSPVPHPMPQRAADSICTTQISPQAALIYRLNGDRNPLHADPEVARNAGFQRPILHGLCTFGHAGLSILRNCCAYAVGRLKSMEARFSRSILPGESLTMEIWRDENVISFRASVIGEEKRVVLDNGRAEISA